MQRKRALIAMATGVSCAAAILLYQYFSRPRCTDIVSIDFKRDFESGRYVADLSGEGYHAHCEFEIPPSKNAAQWDKFHCRGDPVIKMWSGPAPVFSGFKLRAAPPNLRVRVVRDGTVLADQAIEPRTKPLPPWWKRSKVCWGRSVYLSLEPPAGSTAAGG